MPASSLGVVDAHDHLFVRSPALPGQEFDDLARSTQEAREGQQSGIGTIVEMTPIGCGRRPDLMRAVSESTGMPVIAAEWWARCWAMGASEVRRGQFGRNTSLTMTDARSMTVGPHNCDSPTVWFC